MDANSSRERAADALMRDRQASNRPNETMHESLWRRMSVPAIAVRFGGEPRQMLATLLLIGLMGIFAVGFLVPSLPRSALSRSLHLLSPACLGARAGIISDHATQPVQAIWLRIAPNATLPAIDRTITATGLPAPVPAFQPLNSPSTRSIAATLGTNRVFILRLPTAHAQSIAAQAAYFRHVPGIVAVELDRQGLTTDLPLLLCSTNGHTLTPASESLVSQARALLATAGVPPAVLSAPAVVTHTRLLNGTYTLVVFPRSEASTSLLQQSISPYVACFSAAGRPLFAARLNWN